VDDIIFANQIFSFKSIFYIYFLMIYVCDLNGICYVTEYRLPVNIETYATDHLNPVLYFVLILAVLVADIRKLKTLNIKNRFKTKNLICKKNHTTQAVS